MSKPSNKARIVISDKVQATRHRVGNQIRHTIPADGFEKLVAISRGERFLWIHSDFSK